MPKIKQNNKEEMCKTGVFTNGAVVTETNIASEAGVKILMRGGNALDAAIATTVCVGVVNSFSSGIGGGGTMLIKIPGDDMVEMFDFREVAPRNLTPELLKHNPGSTQKTGLSIAVPGEIKGLYDAHCEYGKLPWRELFEDGIELAEGFPATDLLVRKLNTLKDEILSDPGLSMTYTRDNEIVREGDVIVRANYARTLRRIAEDPMSFYDGEIAGKIVKAVKDKGGVMEMQDLRGYRAVKRNVQVGSYKDYTVYAPDLPTSGILIIQALNILENFDLEEVLANDRMNNTFCAQHLIAEVLKFMYARRGELADPEFMDDMVLKREIMSKETACELASRIKMNEVLPACMYGMKRLGHCDHGTTHINVVDNEEMTVLLTTSVNLEFGAKYMDVDTGIVFNNHVDDFDVEGVKNFYGVENFGINALEPLKRPFSSMAPVLLVKDDETIAIGGVGGIRITSSVLFVLFNMFLGKSLRESILEPRLHHQFSPMTIYIEDGFSEAAVRYLESAGHVVERSPSDKPNSAVFAIMIKRDMNGNKTIQAVSDIRKGGTSSGW